MWTKEHKPDGSSLLMLLAIKWYKRFILHLWKRVKVRFLAPQSTPALPKQTPLITFALSSKVSVISLILANMIGAEFWKQPSPYSHSGCVWYRCRKKQKGKICINSKTVISKINWNPYNVNRRQSHQLQHSSEKKKCFGLHKKDGSQVKKNRKSQAHIISLDFVTIANF